MKTRPLYCAACGNPDCPTVSPDAYWRRCPALQRSPLYRPGQTCALCLSAEHWDAAKQFTQPCPLSPEIT